MRIISFNVNGIRSAIRKGLLEWLCKADFDILCLQEVKAAEDQIEAEDFKKLGVSEIAWNAAQKKGYSGVAVFSKPVPDLTALGLGVESFDNEGRIIRVDYGEITVLNCYFPSGASGELRQTAKMKFLDDFYKFSVDLKKTRPKLIVCGDFNIAHTAQDIHDPKGNKNSSGFLPEERAWITKWLNAGFVDSFRYLNPDLVEYSWWTYRANARNNNKGWRIDYCAVSEALKPALINCRQLTNIVQSDHCPVVLDIG